ncbi:unnamed protein product [Lactuca saligna]|uniref:BAH domain-containing protein n=1 Tax=Lactuca saligna TaxID=75948 RepID=A0AA35ZAP0_LACSI|nr:unnamed protein product [Lactuca saligna]
MDFTENPSSKRIMILRVLSSSFCQTLVLLFSSLTDPSFKPSAIFSAGVSFLRLRSGLELFASTIKLVECCIFYMEKVDEDANLEFKWLIKKGRGGKNKEVQFYGSFIYDGVEYVLYDCVYMYKEGLREPYIGKLTKIWENADKSKKVKVHWFFRPEEISKWVGDTKTLENEILFASGEGVGLTNISPLEAIAGKCNVVCVSKDPRNPQPSDEELKAADFIFYRTFDVESCTILDNMDEEKIGGIEIKHIFNTREDESISTLPETTTTTSTDKKEENHNTITITTSSEPKQQLLLTKTLPNTNNLKDDDAQDKNIPILAAETTSVALLEKTNPKIDEKADKDAMEANKRKKSSTTGSDKLHEQPSKKMKLADKNPPKEKQVEVVEVDRDSVGLKDVMPSKKSKVDNNVRTGSKISEIGKTDTSVVKTDKDNLKSSKEKDETKVSKVSKERKKTPMESDKLDDRPLKKMKSKVANEKQKQVAVEGEKIEKLTDLPSKKSKVEDKSATNEKQKQVEVEGEKIEKLKSKAEDKSAPNEKQKQVEVLGEKIEKSKSKAEDKSAPNEKQKQVEVEGEKIEKSTDLPSKKSKDEVKSARNVNNLGTSGTQEEKANGKNNNNEGKISDELEGRRLKKTKAEASFKIPDNKKNSTSTINSNGSNGKNLEKQSESNESKKKLSMNQSPKDMYKEFVVGPKPNADESGWFERLPWEQSLKSAYDQGSAILLHNVDPDYTSGEVEDLVWHAFTENCEAKILPCSVISSPHCYQALVLLKTKEAAQRVLAKLDEDCLMLSNGRPLVGTPCPPIIPRKTCKFFGHLSIDRIKINQREMEEAVSTSHFSQPNTIEYDMAMEWFLMQSKSKKWWEMVHELQGNEFRNSFEEKN